jgi:hypothetical protein
MIFDRDLDFCHERLSDILDSERREDPSKQLKAVYSLCYLTNLGKPKACLTISIHEASPEER